ncbi:MAG: MmgE/PrpD family protein [Rhodospirillales bacterium]|nr:MmgE/PrpD family protein [Rhodospirillales bacterium]
MAEPPATDSAHGATLRLGRWVAEAPRAWGEEAERRAASAFVDTVACMLAGADDAAPRAAHAGVARWGTGGATVAGTPHRLVAPWAALVNGTAAHALDYDDILEISNAHVSAALVPALLALGQERGADGGSCVDAFIVGVEVMARLGEALNMTHYFKGWHTTSTLGAPAAAAACARLLRLDAARTTAALSLATSLASGAKRQFGTMAKPLHAGLAAKNGIVAAALAEAGVSAAADAYEGARGFVDLFAGVPRERLEAAVADFAGPPAIERYGLWQKVYPCCGSVHRPLDALLDMRGDEGLRPQAVAGIDALLPEIAVQNLPYTAPADAMQARFSLPYLLASALVDGRLALDAFTADALARPGVRALIPRIRMRPDPAQPGDVNVDAAPLRATVTVRLAGGDERSRTVQEPRGHPCRPLGRDALHAKFADCASRALPQAAHDAAFAAFDGIAGAPDLGAVAAHLGGGHGQR